jgi:hypothetical protein
VNFDLIAGDEEVVDVDNLPATEKLGALDEVGTREPSVGMVLAVGINKKESYRLLLLGYDARESDA